MRPISAEPLEPVPRPVMRHRWERLTMLHWPYPPEVVRPLLPPGLELDVFDGVAWVGLVPFAMRIRPPRGPGLPWLSSFPETNVRTYAVGPDGHRAIWFLSLDVPRLPAVLAARAAYRLPYHWSRMRLASAEGLVRYEASRRWPGTRGAGGVVVVRAGDPIERPSDLDVFLTARFGLYARTSRGIAYTPVEHPRWPLAGAEVLGLEDSLVSAAGIPPPEGLPAHAVWSPGVDVRIGVPRRVG
jgi:uncharacterized protein YqjF (DUF2071 family)